MTKEEKIKEDKFIKMRKEMIEFVDRERDKKLGRFSTMDIVDCLLVSWIIPYCEDGIDLTFKKYKSLIKRKIKKLKGNAGSVVLDELKKELKIK